MALSICTELIGHSSESLCRSPLENLAYDFAPYFSSSAQQVLIVLLGWIMKLDVIGRTLAVLWGAASRFCSKQLAASSCSPNLVFFRCFIKIQVLQTYSSTNTTAWKNFCFILSKKSDFHMVIKLSIAVHATFLRMLKLLSENEILLPKYVK